MARFSKTKTGGEMKKLISVLFIVAVALVGCKKQYIGEYASMTAPGVCPTPSFPAECRLDYFGNLIPDFYITKINDNGLYLIEGNLDPRQGSLKSWSHIIPERSTFKILFINSNRIFDTKMFTPVETDVGRKLNFKFKYDSKGTVIEGVSFTYNLSVVG